MNPASARTCLRLASVLMAAALLPLPLGAATVDKENLPRARDLQKEASEGRPLVLLFSRTDCPYCRQARVYLRPMAREQGTADAAVYRQIDLDTNVPLKDFQGRPTTHAAFAKAEKFQLTPTVAFYGPTGERLTKPIIGMRLPDFYGEYLNQTLKQARQKMGLNEGQ